MFDARRQLIRVRRAGASTMFHRLATSALAALALLLLLPAANLFADDEERIPDDIAMIRELRYREGTVRNWTLDLARPRGLSGKLRPAIVIIHGGGWIEGDKSSFSTMKNRPPGHIIDFARLGFVAATINYRLSGEAPWPAALHDCRCAVRFLRAHAREYGIDPARIGAWGNSAGGHLALMLGMTGDDAFPPDDGPYLEESSRVQAVASDSGPIDLGHQFHHKQVHTVIERLLGGPPEGARLAVYERASPINHIAAKTPPLLLIYGGVDGQVGIETADRFVLELARAGLKDVNYLRLGTVDHCPHSLIRVPWLQPAVGAFFERTLAAPGAIQKP